MTAYEMCISDWSSDVCSSDLVDEHVDRAELRLDLVEGAGDRFGFAHVAGDRDRLGADRAHRGESGFEMVGLAAKDRDLRAQPGELDRHALAEPGAAAGYRDHLSVRSEEHTSELQSLMRTSYAVFCLKKKKTNHNVIYKSSY